MSVYEFRHTASPQEAANWTRRQQWLTDFRAVGGRAYPRVTGLFREKSWVFFEILLPFLATSAFVFVYRALQAPPEYIGFVVLGGAMTAFWLNVIWMMASQLWWEKSQGNLELYFASPDVDHERAVRDGRRRDVHELDAGGRRAGHRTLVFGVHFEVQQWVLLLAVFVLTLAALYGLGMMLASLFLHVGPRGVPSDPALHGTGVLRVGAQLPGRPPRVHSGRWRWPRSRWPSASTRCASSRFPARSSRSGRRRRRSRR